MEAEFPGKPQIGLFYLQIFGTPQDYLPSDVASCEHTIQVVEFAVVQDQFVEILQTWRCFPHKLLQQRRRFFYVKLRISFYVSLEA